MTHGDALASPSATMVSSLVLLLVLLWSIRIAVAALRLVAFWQVKEYRVDRARAHFGLPSTRRRILGPLPLAKSLLLLAGLLLFPALRVTGGATLAVTALYAGEAASFGWALRAGRLTRPRRTPRALALLTWNLGSTFALAGLTLASSAIAPPLVLLALDLLLPLTTALGVALSSPARSVAHARTVRRAAARIRKHPRLVTIGITGSMGKSSTKEFLATILGLTRRVLKTPANVNTDVGAAQVILESLRPEHDVFVCEMGAYRRGEIARIAAMAKPTVGILTAISDQHLALFGSRERLTQAKGELLRALPPEGTAIVNGDDPRCLARLTQTPAQRRIRFGLGTANDVRAENTLIERTELVFQLHLPDAARSIRAPLLGAQQVPSILAAAAGAHALGLSPDDIAAGIARLRPLPRTMEPRSGPNGAFVIDDTYSANPDGVLAALAYLRTVPVQKRVVVMTTMIELGSAAADAHRRVGEALAALRPALVILTARDYAADLVRGAASREGAAPPIVVETNPVRARARVEALLDPTTVVLLEGRIPETLRSALLT